MSHRQREPFLTCDACGTDLKASNLDNHRARVHGVMGEPDSIRVAAAVDAREDLSPGYRRALEEVGSEMVKSARMVSGLGLPMDMPEDPPEELTFLCGYAAFDRLLSFRYLALRRRLGLMSLKIEPAGRVIRSRRFSEDPAMILAYWAREALHADAFRALGEGAMIVRLPPLDQVQGRTTVEAARTIRIKPSGLRQLAHERPDLLRLPSGRVGFATEGYEALRTACQEISDDWAEAGRLFDLWGTGFELHHEGNWSDEMIRDLHAFVEDLRERDVHLRSAPVEVNDVLALADLRERSLRTLEAGLPAPLVSMVKQMVSAGARIDVPAHVG